MEEKYIPLDDRWIRIGENAYKLPWGKLTKEEKKRKLIWEKNLKIHKENKNIMDCMDHMVDNVEINSATVIIQKYFRRGFLIKKVKNILRLSVNDIKKSKEFNDLNIIGLLIMKILEKKGINKKNKSRKGVHKLIDSKKRGIINKGTKSGNGSDESLRLKWIEEQINNNTEWGIQFKKYYENYYKKTIKGFKIIGGRSNHYDFLINHTDGTSFKCEEKGNKGKYDLYKSVKPWERAVQRLNGNIKNISICEIFAILWYENIVCNYEINSIIGNDLPIPPFNEWYINDCCSQGNPNTDWGRENKKNVKEKWKNGDKKISLNKKNGVPIDGREIIFDDFKNKFTEDVKSNLIQDIHDELNCFMKQKDIWITTCGQIPDIDYRFWNNFEPEEIKDITIKYKKGSDIIFKCITENDDYFKCYLRWGKGCGFSNLRFDIR